MLLPVTAAYYRGRQPGSHVHVPAPTSTGQRPVRATASTVRPGGQLPGTLGNLLQPTTGTGHRGLGGHIPAAHIQLPAAQHGLHARQQLPAACEPRRQLPAAQRAGLLQRKQRR